MYSPKDLATSVEDIFDVETKVDTESDEWGERGLRSFQFKLEQCAAPFVAKSCKSCPACLRESFVGASLNETTSYWRTRHSV